MLKLITLLISSILITGCTFETDDKEKPEVYLINEEQTSAITWDIDSSSVNGINLNNYLLPGSNTTSQYGFTDNISDGSDLVHEVQVTEDGGTVVDHTDPAFLQAIFRSEATYTITYKVTDEAENFNTVSRTITIKDITAPSLTYDLSPNHPNPTFGHIYLPLTIDLGAPLVITKDDLLSDVIIEDVWFTSPKSLSPSTASVTTELSIFPLPHHTSTPESFIFTVPGNYTLSYKIKDVNDNEAIIERAIVVTNDTTPPVIQIPANASLPSQLVIEPLTNTGDATTPALDDEEKNDFLKEVLTNNVLITDNVFPYLISNTTIEGSVYFDEELASYANYVTPAVLTMPAESFGLPVHAADLAGNVSPVTMRSVKIIDQIPPFISVLPETPISLDIDLSLLTLEELTQLVKAASTDVIFSDNYTDDVETEIASILNTDDSAIAFPLSLQDYVITYTASDDSGNITNTPLEDRQRTLTIKDEVKPVLSFNVDYFSIEEESAGKTFNTLKDQLIETDSGLFETTSKFIFITDNAPISPSLGSFTINAKIISTTSVVAGCGVDDEFTNSCNGETVVSITAIDASGNESDAINMTVFVYNAVDHEGYEDFIAKLNDFSVTTFIDTIKSDINAQVNVTDFDIYNHPIKNTTPTHLQPISIQSFEDITPALPLDPYTVTAVFPLQPTNQFSYVKVDDTQTIDNLFISRPSNNHPDLELNDNGTPADPSDDTYFLPYSIPLDIKVGSYKKQYNLEFDVYTLNKQDTKILALYAFPLWNKDDSSNSTSIEPIALHLENELFVKGSKFIKDNSQGLYALHPAAGNTNTLIHQDGVTVAMIDNRYPTTPMNQTAPITQISAMFDDAENIPFHIQEKITNHAKLVYEEAAELRESISDSINVSTGSSLPNKFKSLIFVDNNLDAQPVDSNIKSYNATTTQPSYIYHRKSKQHPNFATSGFPVFTCLNNETEQGYVRGYAGFSEAVLVCNGSDQPQDPIYYVAPETPVSPTYLDIGAAETSTPPTMKKFFSVKTITPTGTCDNPAETTESGCIATDWCAEDPTVTTSAACLALSPPGTWAVGQWTVGEPLEEFEDQWCPLNATTFNINTIELPVASCSGGSSAEEATTLEEYNGVEIDGITSYSDLYEKSATDPVLSTISQSAPLTAPNQNAHKNLAQLIKTMDPTTYSSLNESYTVDMHESYEATDLSAGNIISTHYTKHSMPGTTSNVNSGNPKAETITWSLQLLGGIPRFQNTEYLYSTEDFFSFPSRGSQNVDKDASGTTVHGTNPSNFSAFDKITTGIIQPIEVSYFSMKDENLVYSIPMNPQVGVNPDHSIVRVKLDDGDASQNEFLLIEKRVNAGHDNIVNFSKQQIIAVVNDNDTTQTPPAWSDDDSGYKVWHYEYEGATGSEELTVKSELLTTQIIGEGYVLGPISDHSLPSTSTNDFTDTGIVIKFFADSIKICHEDTGNLDEEDPLYDADCTRVEGQ